MSVGSIFGYPLQNDVFWYKETTYSGGIPATSRVTMWVSEVVTVARVDVAETKKPLRGISEPSVIVFVSTTSDYTLHLEWVWEKTDTYSIVSDCVNRRAGGTFIGDLPSLAFVIRTNEVASDKTYYLIKGGKCKNINIKSATDDYYICSADFSVASMTLSNTAPSYFTAPAKPTGGQYAFFNRVGSVVRKNSTATIGYIVDGIDVTINNHLTDIWNNGIPWKQNSISGQMDITGTAQVMLDHGGSNFNTYLYATMTDIVIDTYNGNTLDVLTLTSAEWQGATYEINNGDAPMKTAAKFTAKKATLGS